MKSGVYYIRLDANNRYYYTFKDWSFDLDLVSVTYMSLEALKKGIVSFREVLKHDLRKRVGVKRHFNHVYLVFYDENMRIICSSKNYACHEDVDEVINNLRINALHGHIVEDI